MTARLRVLLHDQPAGWLRRTENGNLQFAYDSDYVERGGSPLSHSMPVTTERYPHRTCLAVFGGLLPEQDVRLAIARLRGISPTNDYRLLEELGGDCAGAVRFLPDEASQVPPSLDRVRVLDESELDRVLAELPSRPLAMVGADSARLSLAGAQGKLPVVVRDGAILLPLADGPPTTHIIKPEPERFPGLVENEFTCMQLARRVGLSVARVERSITRSGLPYLLVERYDRTVEEGVTRRVHQEDVCQALARLPHEKYQAEGGPTVAETAALVRAATFAPALDIPRFWDALVFNALLGNCDAHGKNYSLLYTRGRPTLAPLYDLVCTVAFPELSTRLAMTIGGATCVDDVDPAALERSAIECGLAPRTAVARARSLAARTRAAAEDMVSSAESAEGSGAGVLRGVMDRAQRLEG